MTRLEPYACEGLVVAPTIATVLGQEKWMVNAGLMPERDTVFMVFQQAGEDGVALYVSRVVSVKAYEEKLRLCRIGSLVRLARK